MDNGKLSWFDFATKDADKAMAFYKQILGWTFESSPTRPNYWVIRVGDQMIGGLRKDEQFKPSQGFVSYFTVASVKEGCGMITKAGGQLVGATVDIQNNMGFFQIFKDIDGNTMAIWSHKP